MKHRRRMKKSPIIALIFLLIAIVGIVYVINNKTTKTPVKEPAPQPVVVEDKTKKMSIIAVGDVLIHESVYLDARKSDGTYDFHYMFTDIEPIIKKYDLRYCNVESTIGGSALGISGYPSFNSPDEIGDELVNLGFNLISLANNHALDKGEDAVLYSNAFWKKKDVITAGAYSSYEEQNEIKTYEKNGIKYAFFAYTTSSNRAVNKGYLVNMYSDERARSDIEAVKDKVDVIIVSMHWGSEYTKDPTYEETRIAEYLSGLGVNLVIGAHPHVVQPVRYVGDTLVIYSLGNFISNQLSIADNYAYDTNPGIGLMVGVDIVVDEDGKVSFENIYKELILAYAEHSTNFKVIPFSNLNDDLFYNYKNVETTYMNIVNG